MEGLREISKETCVLTDPLNVPHQITEMASRKQQHFAPKWILYFASFVCDQSPIATCTHLPPNFVCSTHYHFVLQFNITCYTLLEAQVGNILLLFCKPSVVIHSVLAVHVLCNKRSVIYSNAANRYCSLEQCACWRISWSDSSTSFLLRSCSLGAEPLTDTHCSTRSPLFHEPTHRSTLPSDDGGKG
jgi:hypothetical protein